MKSILAFFFLIFISLGTGVYLYEMKIVSLNADDALGKSNKKVTTLQISLSAVKVNKQAIEETPSRLTKQSRVIDLSFSKPVSGKLAKGRMGRQKMIEKSISNTIKKLVRLEIQNAVVAEIAKK